jgi:mycothiol synthase
MTPPVGSDAIVVAGAPSLPGLAFRRRQPGKDEQAMAELHNRCYEADRIPMRETAASIDNELRHIATLDPVEDIVLGELDGRLVAEGRTYRETELDGTVTLLSWCWIDPAVRGRGLGRAILRHQEDRLRAATIAADAPDGPRRYRAVNAETETGGIDLVESVGYRHVRTFFEMERSLEGDLPDVPLPDGFEVRPFNDEATARLALAAINEGFRDHWAHCEMTEDDVAETLGRPDQDIGLWMVAWQGDEIAGVVVPMVLASENAITGRRHGWLDIAATRRPWRGRGLASALFARSMAALRERGMTTVGLGVDSENVTGALGIYERLGFAVVQRFFVYEKPFEAD